MVRRRKILACALCIGLVAQLGLVAQSRIALVIGNGDYKRLPKIATAVNDAADVALALKELGYEVQLLLNADKASMKDGIQGMYEKLSADVKAEGFVWYSGHATQFYKENFLLPVDADVKRAIDLDDSSINLGRIMDLFDEANNRINVVMLDACRPNNLPAFSRGATPGLAPIGEISNEALVMYSAGANEIVPDVKGRNGVFAQSVLKYIGQAGDISQTVDAIASDVRRQGKNAQTPYAFSRIASDYSLKPVRESGRRPDRRPGGNDRRDGPEFGAVEASPGSVVISAATTGTLDFLGKTVSLQAGAKLPVKNVAPGSYLATMNYANGLKEELKVVVESGKEASVEFVFVERTKDDKGDRLRPRPTDRDKDRTPKGFVKVNGGSFPMGDSLGDLWEECGPVHQVALSDFYMAETELTQAEWQKLMGDNPSLVKGDSLPVSNISWYEAVAFCNKLSQSEGLKPAYVVNGQNVSWNREANGYRLPTEAEWEYAAAGGGKFAQRPSAYSGGERADDVAWYFSPEGTIGKPVAQKKANALGIYDMSGNVWEWCYDMFGPYTSNAQQDPEGPKNGLARVIRGGSEGSGPVPTRIAFRCDANPAQKSLSLGFRVVRSAF